MSQHVSLAERSGSMEVQIGQDVRHRDIVGFCVTVGINLSAVPLTSSLRMLLHAQICLAAQVSHMTRACCSDAVSA